MHASRQNAHLGAQVCPREALGAVLDGPRGRVAAHLGLHARVSLRQVLQVASWDT